MIDQKILDLIDGVIGRSIRIEIKYSDELKRLVVTMSDQVTEQRVDFGIPRESASVVVTDLFVKNVYKLRSKINEFQEDYNSGND